MSLDVATLALLAQMETMGITPPHELTPAEARAQIVRRPPPGDLPEMVSVTDRQVSAAGGVVPVRILVPNDAPRGIIVYYHGGGWVLGSVEASDVVGRFLAARTGCAVVIVGYRLAPEYRFPTAVDDAYAALCWLDQRVEDIAGKQVPLIVCGDSSGGTLAAVTAIRARDRKGPKIAVQVLVYPVTEADFNTLSYQDPENSGHRMMLTREAMMWFWDQYAPDPVSRQHPDASPMRVLSTAGLPPAIVVTAEVDVLRDESELYATRLVKAGVPVEFRRFDGQMHSFFNIVVLPGSALAFDFIAGALDRLLEKDGAE